MFLDCKSGKEANDVENLVNDGKKQFLAYFQLPLK